MQLWLSLSPQLRLSVATSPHAVLRLLLLDFLRPAEEVAHVFPGSGGAASLRSMARLRKPKIVRRLEFAAWSLSSAAASASNLCTAVLCCTLTCFKVPVSFSGKRRPTSLRRLWQANRAPKNARHNLAHSLENSVMSNTPPGWSPCAATSPSCCGPSALSSKHISVESSTWVVGGRLACNLLRLPNRRSTCQVPSLYDQ